VNLIILPIRVSVDMTRKCISSLLQQDIPVKILAIDNGSEDGCAQYLRSCWGVQIITYPRPMGLSRLWNNCLEMSFEHMKLEHVLVVNNDTVLRPDTYRLLLEDGGSFVTGVGVDTAAKTLRADPSSKRPHPDFSCFMIRRECWETTGRFDESMMTWASDNDYHVRMFRAGIDAHCISLPFYHVASGTLKHLDGEIKQALYRQSDKDRERFREKYGCSPGTPEYEALFTTQP
jgi:GT2 family glycosyltransferase